MYYARQVSYENQDSWLFDDFTNKQTHHREVSFNDDFYNENVILDGNKDYVSITTSEYDTIKRNMYDVAYSYENPYSYGFQLTSDINYYFPKKNGKKWSKCELHQWKLILDKYIQRYEIEDIIIDALNLMTGKQWREIEIKGCCQGDYQYGYASNEVTQESIDYIEICFFNTGEEWIVYENEEDFNNNENGCSYYIDGWHNRENLANQIGCEPNEIIMYKFDGYSQTPRYELQVD